MILHFPLICKTIIKHFICIVWHLFFSSRIFLDWTLLIKNFHYYITGTYQSEATWNILKHSETFFTNKVHCLVNFASYKKYPIAALTLISFCNKLLMLSYYLHIHTFTKNSSNVPHGLYRWWQLNWQTPFKTLSINYHDCYDITILINGCFLFDNARWVAFCLKVCSQFPLKNCVQLWHITALWTLSSSFTICLPSCLEGFHCSF